MPIYNLPGVSSNIDVKAIVDKLVELESKKVARFEEEKEILDKKKSSWSNLSNKLSDLQEASKQLYGFRSPFEEKIAQSSDESIVSAEAVRVAEPQKVKIKVLQIASSERVLSNPIDSKKIFAPVKLRLMVGEDEVDVNFTGGRVDELAEAITEQSDGLLKAKTMKNTRDTSLLILETVKTGKDQHITPKDDETISFLSELGLFEKAKVFQVDTSIEQEKLTSLIQGKVGYEVIDGTLRLSPESKVEMRLDKDVPVREGIVLRIKIAAELKEKEKEVPKEVKWPELKPAGKVKIRDVEVYGESPVSKIEREVPKVERPPVEDFHLIALANERGILKEIEIKDVGAEFKEYVFNVKDILPPDVKFDRIIFLNRNTEKIIKYSDFVIEDTMAREGLQPTHLVQSAQDAEFLVDGVKITRPSNQIDDVIKGVTLNLKKVSESEVEVNIDRDYEKITNGIITLIEKYNEVIKFINEKTKIVSTGELEGGIEAGILAGDITIMGLKNKLQNIMMNPYPTDEGKRLSLLAQIGISMGSTGSAWSDIKGGTLQIDEDKFIEAFRNYPESIKQLFGNDTNNDMIIDEGVAYRLDNILKGYIDKREGIITYRIKNSENEIKEQEKKIEDWQEHVEEYRKKLEKDFTVMQEALRELELNQKRIENFSNQIKRTK